MKAKINYIGEQAEIAERTDALYKSGKRLVGNVLSTGGGKSFLGMDQIIKHAQNYNTEVPLTEEDIQNGKLTNILIEYYAPTNIILQQFQVHMIKNIIIPEYTIDAEFEEASFYEVMKILSKINPNLKVTEAKFKEFFEDAKFEAKDSDDAKAIIVNTLKKITDSLTENQLAKTVQRAFPNLEFSTFAGLEKKTNNDLEKSNAKLIIFDEAHRTGAEKWWPKVKTLVEDTKADIFAITATPERDVDERDMMVDLALLNNTGYSIKEVRQRKFLACNIPLMKAIEKGILTPPEIIHFNCTLDETAEFEKILKKFTKSKLKVLTTSPESKSYYKVMNEDVDIKKNFNIALKTILLDSSIDYDDSLTEIQRAEAKMQDENRVDEYIKQISRGIFDFLKYNRTLSDDKILKNANEIIQNLKMIDDNGNEVPWRELKEQRISKIIENVMRSRDIVENSKAITFIESMDRAPKGETQEEKKERAELYKGKTIEEIKKLFSSFSEKLKPSVNIIHSEANTKQENDEVLTNFTEPFSRLKKAPMKIVAAVSKFNEGFHPENIRALFMIKPIAVNKNKEGEPRIILLQQLGRVLSAKGEQAVVFDIANNFMRNHEKFIADLVKADKEKNSCFDFLKLTQEEKTFLKATDSLNREQDKEDKIDIEKAIVVLNVLQKNRVPVDYENVLENETLESYISKITDENLKEKILDDLFIEGIELNSDTPYKFGRDYKVAREALLGVIFETAHLKIAKSSLENIIRNEIATLKPLNEVTSEEISKRLVLKMLDLGIIDIKTESGRKTLGGEKGKRIINDEGFIVKGVIEEIACFNVYTGTKYDGPETDENRKDYFGLLPNGRDVAGYDKDGFDENGIHRLTGMNFDERHFTKTVNGWRYLCPETGELLEYDPLGFNHEGIRKDGFDRNGYWHAEKEDDTYSIIKSSVNPNTKRNSIGALVTRKGSLGEFCKNDKGGKKLENINGFRADRESAYPVNEGLMSIYRKSRPDIFEYFNEHPEQRKYYSEVTKDQYGNDIIPEIRDVDGYDIYGFNPQGYNRDTSTRYDKRGKDVDRKSHPSIQLTRDIIDELSHLKNGSEKVNDILKKLNTSREKVDIAIAETMMFARMSDEFLNDESNAQMFNTLNRRFNVAQEVMNLSPTAVRIEQKSAEANKKMIKYFSDRVIEIITNPMVTKSGEFAKLNSLAEKLNIDMKTGKVIKEQPYGASHSVQYMEETDEDFYINN